MHFKRLEENGEKAKNASFLPQKYSSGFLFEEEEYDLGLKRICRFKALTSSFSSSIKGGSELEISRENKQLALRGHQSCQSKTRLPLFYLSEKRKILYQVVPFKNAL